MDKVEKNEVMKEKQPFRHQAWWWVSEGMGVGVAGARADSPAASGEDHCEHWNRFSGRTGDPMGNPCWSSA